MQILRRYYERARNSLQEPNTDAAHRLDRVYSENILRIMPQLDEIVEGAKQINDIVCDYCFQYARSINLTNSPFRMLTNKDSLFFLSLSYL